MKLETWIGIAVVGLAAMFAGLINSFYNFLIGPEGKGPDQVVDPGGLLIQNISISGAPCLILAGIAFGMAKSYGSKPAGMLLIAAGAIMIAGMAFAITIVPKIPSQFVVTGIEATPYIFIAGGVGVAAVGGYLLAASKKHVENLDDLR